MQAGYPPAIIRKEERKQYIASIEKAQLGGSLADYYALMYEAVSRSLDIYLEVLEDKKQEKILEKKNVLKIGELAELVGETVPTIRHWTKEGLLNVAEYSQSGYQLYDQDQAAVIKQAQADVNSKWLAYQATIDGVVKATSAGVYMLTFSYS